MKRGDSDQFIVTCGEIVYHRGKGWFRAINTDYITEDGKLLEAVHKWSKEHPNG